MYFILRTWKNRVIFLGSLRRHYIYRNHAVCLLSVSLSVCVCPSVCADSFIAYCFCPVCHSVWNFNLAIKFWPWSLPVMRPFRRYHIFLLWPLPWSLTNYLKTLTLLITFEQWVLGLWYFTIIFYPLILTLEYDPFLETLTFLLTFEQWVLELWYFTWIFPVIRPFRTYHYLWPWPWSFFHLANIF